MKRDNVFGVWQRCRACGTVFPSPAELQEHLQTHVRKLVKKSDQDYDSEEQPEENPRSFKHQSLTPAS